MAKIIISVLHFYPINTFVYCLNIEQTKSILGGTYPYSFFVMNTSDSLYIGATRSDQRFYAVGAYSSNISDSKYDTIDYSRSIHNTFINFRNRI